MVKLYTIILTFIITLNINAESDYDPRFFDPYSQNSYGGIGLIETPTARFSNDGEFAFGASSEGPYRRLYSKMQFFPWAEAVLRYTEGTFKPYNAGSHQTWKDKGLDLKIRLLKETEKFPQLSIGAIDLGGTGSFSSEYLVASKRFNNLDWTIGIAWGKLAGVDHFNNVIGVFDKNRRIRGGFDRRGGTLNLDRFFSGENNSIFGGLEYFTPIENLSLKIEYDTSSYEDAIGKREVFNKDSDRFELDSRVNIALNYKMFISNRDQVDIALGFIRGNTIYANFSIHSNLNYGGRPKVVIGPEKIRNSNLPSTSFNALEQKWQDFLTNRIIKEMANSGFVTHKVIFNETELAAELSQGRFLETTKFLDLASKILANNSLQNIETITVINIDHGIETLRSSVSRNDVRRAALNGPLPEDILEFNNLKIIDDEPTIRENEYLYPNFYWEIVPRINNTIQHQERFFFWQLEALIHTEYSIRQGLYLTTDIGINIDNNFDDYTYHIPDGKLYHVRQNRRLYLTEGKTGIRRMAIDQLFNINTNLKARLSFGYLEWMYGGFGAEVLYMPDHRRWAIGMDTYWVKQRDYDQKFSFKDYSTTTGFITYYQDIPFYDLRLKASFGKFLAKDVGAMIDISRRFSTGARVGGFFALTDCDSACVGEGSFHKGVYFELPLDLFFVDSTTRNKTGYSWSPLTKDAGAKVDTGNLYHLMMNASDEVPSLRMKNWSLKKIFSGFGTREKERI